MQFFFCITVLAITVSGKTYFFWFLYFLIVCMVKHRFIWCSSWWSFSKRRISFEKFYFWRFNQWKWNSLDSKIHKTPSLPKSLTHSIDFIDNEESSVDNVLSTSTSKSTKSTLVTKLPVWMLKILLIMIIMMKNQHHH